MNPSRMSDYKVQKWRVTTRFKKISDLVSKLQSSFDELKGDNLTLGYISPGHGAKGKKHWLNVKEEQLPAWAHLIHIGKHESRVEVPKFPFFRGKSCKKQVIFQVQWPSQKNRLILLEKRQQFHQVKESRCA